MIYLNACAYDSRFVAFCCGLVLSNFTRILQGYFICNGTTYTVAQMPMEQPGRTWISNMHDGLCNQTKIKRKINVCLWMGHPALSIPPSPPTSSGRRADSRFVPSQRETSLQSNAVSHWLGANLESAQGCRCSCGGFRNAFVFFLLTHWPLRDVEVILQAHFMNWYFEDFLWNWS